jgi:phytoene dehydrogenase-like protein
MPHYYDAIVIGAGYHTVGGMTVTEEDFARVYLQCRGGSLPSAPMIVSWNDSAIDPSHAPAGKALMKFVVLSVPYVITGDATDKIPARTWDEAREPYADYLIDLITANYIPDLKAKILKRVAHSPVDISRKIISAVRGTLGQGAFLPYQSGSQRPIPELGQYRTPVPNVYLCSSGSHPGPGVSMAPGRNAAQVIFADLGLDFKSVVSGDC